MLISLALQIWKSHITLLKTSSGLKAIIKLTELFGNRFDNVLSILEKNQKSREMTSLNMKNRIVENLLGHRKKHLDSIHITLKAPFSFLSFDHESRCGMKVVQILRF